MERIIEKVSHRLTSNCNKVQLTRHAYLLSLKSKNGLLLSPQAGRLFMTLLLILLFASPVIKAQNAIVTENQKAGNPASEWDISGAGNLTIQGFATDISVNKGETVRFKIKTTATAYTINIYRLGYYQGNGARKVGTGIITATLPQTQPADLKDNNTGLIDCGNWNESANWVVPATAVSGIYIAKLIRSDNGGASHIVFIVRDDASTSNLYFQTSDATWQAYNGYGGNSLYVGNTSLPGGHAAKVSYNRPFYTRNGGGGGGAAEDFLFNAEYPMIRWLERNGYDMTYTTNVDADRRGNLIKNHKVFLSVGHDEYWSAQQRANVEAARSAGVHLAFFSSNEIYWKTRWESSIDVTNTSYRTLVCYKEGTLGENTCGGKCDPLTSVWTGLWRDGCNYPSADGCRPENSLSGQISWNETTGAITVPATYKSFRFWRNTSIATLSSGQTATLSNGTLGYEIDYEQNNGAYPAGRVVMSQTAINSVIHKLSLYRAASGALVFGSGTAQWSWGLDGTHDRGGSTPDSRIQQATVNLFADMGVQPGSLQTGLVAAVATNDLQAPATVISSPQNGGVVTPNVAVTISGTATETAGVVAGVEISVDGGITWLPANGTTSWSYIWTPTANGTYTIKSRAVDDMANLETTATTSNTIQVSTTTTTTYYRDADGDLFGNPGITATGTTPPAGYVSNNTDCNDNDATINPAASEVCDGKDNNCDGTTDEGCNVPADGPGGPVLVISTVSNPYTRYFVEILRAEGLNEFAAKDISQVTATDLNNYNVVILGEMSLSAAHVTMLTNWVNAGGTLIAMRPDAQLSSLLGVTPVTGSLTDKYLLVNTATEQGKGIVGQTIQFHGPANLYTLSGATSLATLYSSATASTTNPAVTIRDVGTNGGQAVAFAYDLARSVVYTRQGNPAWAGQERDAQPPIRSNDLYWGNASFDLKPDWVDLNKVAIPQADEQQHLLTNIIIKGNADKMPLPRFWFLPRGLKATIVMTGDDHANGGTVGRFDQYKALSSSNTLAAVKNWTAIRSSSYIYPGAPITDAQAKSYQTDSFDISLHLNTNCADWTATSLQNFYTTQLQQLTNQLPGLLRPATHRVHCLVWSDWASEPKVELNNKIRLNASYYYWPGSWLQNRSGMFTGSGMPMRFADINGSIIDNYQLTTQMTDESDQIYPDFVDALLNKATGPEGYYGVFCANMHTDNVVSTGSDAIINSAINYNVPVVSAKQMLTWLDGRNASTFNALTWNNNALSFSISAASGANNLEAMLPMDLKTSRLTTITVNGSALTYRIETIKGIRYAFFPATTANFVAAYNGSACTPPTATLNAAPADCQGKSIVLKLSAATGVPPYSVVVNNQTYSNVIVEQNFATISTEQSIWGTSGTPQNSNLNDGQAIEIGVKIRASQSGTITGIRFYKGTNNTGTHTGNLWSAAGAKLASAIFSNESASGWQEVRFGTPVTISANTTYVASYLSGSGGYALTSNFFSSGVTTGSLTALQSGVDGANGVYKYGGGFPTQSFNSGNYWVDVLFKPSSSYTFTLTGITDANGCNNTGTISTATVTQSDLQSASQTFYQDNDGDSYGNSAVTVSGCTAPAGYVARGGDCNDNNAKINPGMTELCSNGIDDNCDGRIDEGCNIFYRDADNDTYGNPADSTTAASPPVGYVSNNTDCNDNNPSVNPGATEVCGNGIDDNCNGTADEGCTVSTEQSIWGTSGTPASSNDYDGQTIEVGVKFRASQSGTITGIRFYKGTSNTGTHTGNLWTSAGTKMASATFNNETASGWQEVRFSTAVAISANTTYVASCFSSSGRYASTNNFFTSNGVTNGSLTALQSGVDGANGVYKYGASGFPTSSFSATNYWVDVLFKPAAAGNTAPVLAAIGPKSITTGQTLSFTATATDADAGQTLTFSLINAPQGAVINATSGAFNWTPSQAGSFTFSVRVTDNGSPALSAEEAITVTVVNNSLTYTLSPLADAFIRNGSYAAINYGTNVSLVAKSSNSNGFTRISYLKFSLSSVSNVRSAKLRIYGRNTENTSLITLSAFGVDNDSWTETGITWNNAPVALPTALSSTGVNELAKYYELDVTSYVKNEFGGDKTVSLMIKDPGKQNKTLTFNSRENAQNKPELVIDTSTSLASRSNYYESLAQPKEALQQSKVFPNPLNKIFNIELSKRHTGRVSFQIIDPVGKVYQVTKSKIKATFAMEVDISNLNLTPGIHFLKILSGQKSEIIKLVIQK